MEQWKDIKGYEGLYQVSDLGRVRSLDKYVWNIHNQSYSLRKGKILKQGKGVKNSQGQYYRNVKLYKDGKHKSFKVHRLVAKAFIENPDNLPFINHKDENPENSQACNLEWCDQKYNVNYGTGLERSAKKHINHPLKSKPISQYTLDGEFVASYPSIAEAERQVPKVFHNNISKCCKGKLNRTGGFKWSYV